MVVGDGLRMWGLDAVPFFWADSESDTRVKKRIADVLNGRFNGMASSVKIE